MNKRQKKKLSLFAQLKQRKKTKAFITVDTTTVSEGSQIDIYVPEKYEAKSESEQVLVNTIQNKNISITRILKDNYDLAFYVKNRGAENKKVNITVWLEDKPFPYAIRPKIITE